MFLLFYNKKYLELQKIETYCKGIPLFRVMYCESQSSRYVSHINFIKLQ